MSKVKLEEARKNQAKEVNLSFKSLMSKVKLEKEFQM